MALRLIALLFLIFSATPAFAATLSLPTEVLYEPDCPVTIFSCDTALDNSSSTLFPNFLAGCHMMNDDPARVVSVVRFDFIFFDDFGSPLGQYATDAEGTYSPHVMIDLHQHLGLPYWNFAVQYPGARSILVGVEKIRFDDGTVFVPNYAAALALYRERHGIPNPVPISSPAAS